MSSLLVRNTVNFAYNDTRRGIRKVSLFVKCRYTRSLIICAQWDGTLPWAWKSCRYSRIVVISAVVISEVDCSVTMNVFFIRLAQVLCELMMCPVLGIAMILKLFPIRLLVKLMYC